MSTTIIGIGEYGVSSQPGTVIKTYALGSCIAVILLDPATRTVGMAHVALPESKINPGRAEKLPGYFADTALTALLAEFANSGGGPDPRRYIVKMVGGANVMDTNNTFNIGKRNVLAMKKALWGQKMGAKVEDVGGNISRTVAIHVDTGKVIISSPGRGEKQI
ncbi:MAG: chemotaxis protein CheD [bacterium]